MLPPETEHPRDVWHALDSFLEELSNHLSASRLEKILFDTAELSGSDVGGKPEAFTEDELIFPLLNSVDLRWRREPGHDRPYQEWPDFELTNTAIPAIGESKPVNRYDEAMPEIKEYLGRELFDTPYGIVTDGIGWVIVGSGVGEGRGGYEKIEHVSLREALQFIAHRQGYAGLRGLPSDPRGYVLNPIAAFVDTFHRPRFDEWTVVGLPLEERRRYRSEEADDQFSLT
jgi:hypothetical protein